MGICIKTCTEFRSPAYKRPAVSGKTRKLIVNYHTSYLASVQLGLSFSGHTEAYVLRILSGWA
jgi:hypothetical protein